MPPIYAFSCNECGHDFESLMRPSDPVECPKCDARESQSLEQGKFVKKMSVTTQHIWKCAHDGAMPKGTRS